MWFANIVSYSIGCLLILAVSWLCRRLWFDAVPLTDFRLCRACFWCHGQEFFAKIHAKELRPCFLLPGGFRLDSFFYHLSAYVHVVQEGGGARRSVCTGPWSWTARPDACSACTSRVAWRALDSLHLGFFLPNVGMKVGPCEG